MPTSVLLVEGVDDQHVIWSLLEHHAVPETFKVQQKGGVNNLLEVLPVQLKGSDIVAVGVVLDADENLAGRWQSLRARLEAAGYTTCPALPEANGTIILGEGLPRFGAWLMPDNHLPGMLEHFVSFLVPQDDNLWPLAEQVVDDLPEPRRFIDNHSMKAKVHTWLAWQTDPGTPMGLAITKKYLVAEAECVQPLLDWLSALFPPA